MVFCPRQLRIAFFTLQRLPETPTVFLACMNSRLVQQRPVPCTDSQVPPKVRKDIHNNLPTSSALCLPGARPQAATGFVGCTFNTSGTGLGQVKHSKTLLVFLSCPFSWFSINFVAVNFVFQSSKLVLTISACFSMFFFMLVRPLKRIRTTYSDTFFLKAKFRPKSFIFIW